MFNNNFEPQELHLIVDDDQIKGYVHPTRMVILQMLALEQRTITSVARELNVHPANLTHHFKLLERVGLICLVEKRDNGKNLEKYYRAIAYHFEVKPKDNRPANKNALALSILKNDLETAINTVQADDGSEVLALLGTAKLGPEDIGSFIKKLEALFEEFKECDSKEGTVYAINLSLYPNETNSVPQNRVVIE